jgi:hypothetical protein
MIACTGRRFRVRLSGLFSQGSDFQQQLRRGEVTVNIYKLFKAAVVGMGRGGAALSVAAKDVWPFLSKYHR